MPMSAEFLFFGEWLKARRLERRMSQETLAGKADISKAYVSALERGKPHPSSARPRQPDLNVVDRIALALGVALDEARQAAGYAPPPRSILPHAAPETPTSPTPSPDSRSNMPSLASPEALQCAFESWAERPLAGIRERLDRQESLLEEMNKIQRQILNLLSPQSNQKTKHRAEDNPKR
jgi:transcriptional regulator with XRE-family HTH domain